jgi:osmotically-inducible protein OsmY
MARRYDWLLFAAVMVFVMAGTAVPSAADDATLQAKVEAQLRLDPRLNWELLHVKVEQGQVTLFGEVASPEEKGWAETVASTVPGVKGLTNNLLIEPALATDHKLRRDIWSALKTVPALERNPTLNVTVQNGEAILEGEVQGIAAQKAAEKAAQSVEGVRKVVNQLKIVPEGSRPKIDATTRNPILDGERQVVP